MILYYIVFLLCIYVCVYHIYIYINKLMHIICHPTTYQCSDFWSTPCPYHTPSTTHQGGETMISSDLHRLMLKTTGGFQGIVPVVPAIVGPGLFWQKRFTASASAMGSCPQSAETRFLPKGKEAVGPSQTAEKCGERHGTRLGPGWKFDPGDDYYCSGISLLSVLLLLYFIIIKLSWWRLWWWFWLWSLSWLFGGWSRLSYMTMEVQYVLMKYVLMGCWYSIKANPIAYQSGPYGHTKQLQTKIPAEQMEKQRSFVEGNTPTHNMNGISALLGDLRSATFPLHLHVDGSTWMSGHTRELATT